MSFASILVHVDAGAGTPARAQLAAALADRFGSVLIGAAALAPPPAVIASGDIVGGSMIEDDVATSELQDISARLADCERQFRSVVAGNRAAEWRSSIEPPTEFIARQARAADLIVIGRDRISDSVRESLDPGSLLLRAGRPVLAVPPAVASLRAERIVIGWKDSREARRAVRDSMPLLLRANEVIIVEACRRGEELGAKEHVEDVADYLIRHRVAVGSKLFIHVKTSTGKELIRLAADESADLIVAGAYGHSRLGEWIFGGVTRDLLATAPMCCLFAH